MVMICLNFIPIGIVMEVGRGTISSIMGVGEYIIDLIPVDVVCNTLITAAWANSFMRPQNELVVYNCISGQVNPFTWHGLNAGIVKYARKYPSKYITLYPYFRYTTNRPIHILYEIFLHFLPAFITDLMLRMQGKKPIMMKISKRFKMAADTGEYFSSNEWIFGVDNLKRVIRASEETQLDSDEFNCDIKSINWDTYMEKYMLGIRQFLLKDDMSSLPKARRKLQKIIWTKRVFQLILSASIFYLIFTGIWN
jgi:alcohol-forming fatty acyl-CoA reductase